MQLEELQLALARANCGSLTIAVDGSSYFVQRWGLHRFNSLPELSRFVEQINGASIGPISPISPTTTTGNAS